MSHTHRRRLAVFTCSQCLGALCDYVDRTHDASTGAAVERHLVGCRKCRILFETTARTVSLYHTIACECCVPPDVEARLLTVISERVGAGRTA